MKLRRNELCPIHRSLFCCGREQSKKERRLRVGVQRIEDPHHPRGYRELRSTAEMRKLLNRKIAEQGRRCAICHNEFTDYSDIAPDHRHPKGMGGGWRDDHPENIQATKAIAGQIGTLDNAFASMANQQKNITSQIVTANKLLLEELILLGGEWAW